MKCDFINYEFLKSMIAVIIGAIIPVVSSYILEKKRLTNNKRKIRFEQNLNTLRKLKVNHLNLTHLINDNYVFCEYMSNDKKSIIDQSDKIYINYLKKLYYTSLKNIKLNNELLNLEIKNISELHKEIISFIDSRNNNTEFNTTNLEKYSKLVENNILNTIKKYR
ncbi:hypothetical protein [Gemella cuniculi]|uniref:hypothetical protein n=1 Tax=Gemella cuniculi TaxID=150240 RepID=UPI00040572A2|nr:hypothetical protein [Gemella cuniculi]